MKLSPYHQEHPHTCLPACLRIVLDYWEREHTEAELAHACGTVPLVGTSPEDAIIGLEQMGYHALWFENAKLSKLRSILEQDWPVIIFLHAASLPYGHSGLHAIVLAAITGSKIRAIDPALGKEIQLALNEFLHAWDILGNQGMVVWIPSAITAD